MKKISFILGTLISFNANALYLYQTCNGKDQFNEYQYVHSYSVTMSGKVSDLHSSLTVSAKDEKKVYDLPCSYDPSMGHEELCYDGNYAVKRPIYTYRFAELYNGSGTEKIADLVCSYWPDDLGK